MPEFKENKINKILTLIPVMESFYTIQGEGAFTGEAAYFIRLAGCNVGCHWCDVKESWEIHSRQYKKNEEIVAAAAEYPSRTVVITGGEPLMHDLTQLTAGLKEAGFRIHIETSGAYNLTGEIDWICLSPKKFKFPLDEIYSKANELKIIIYNKSDFKWAEQQAARVSKNCLVFLQPEWGKADEMIPEIVEYVKSNPEWKISLQTHKFMNIP